MKSWVNMGKLGAAEVVEMARFMGQGAMAFGHLSWPLAQNGQKGEHLPPLFQLITPVASRTTFNEIPVQILVPWDLRSPMSGRRRRSANRRGASTYRLRCWP